MNEYLTAEQNAGIDSETLMTAEQILDRDEKDTDTQAAEFDKDSVEFDKELVEINKESDSIPDDSIDLDGIEEDDPSLPNNVENT